MGVCPSATLLKAGMTVGRLLKLKQVKEATGKITPTLFTFTMIRLSLIVRISQVNTSHDTAYFSYLATLTKLVSTFLKDWLYAVNINHRREINNSPELHYIILFRANHEKFKCLQFSFYGLFW